jgi:NADP-dependent 3-hydroxy acid dehydrogenase YdfG
VAVITGEASGIVLALARYWTEQGGRAVLGDVAQETLEKAAAELRALGGEVATVAVNVTREMEACARAPRGSRRAGQETAQADGFWP